MEGLFGYQVSDKTPKKKKDVYVKYNPLLKTFGYASDPKLRCKDCQHLYAKEFAKRYYKCELRPDTNGPGTDHRKFWPACGKIKPI